MAGRKPVNDRSRVRSKRISATLTPDVYDGLTALARAAGVSASDIIGALVEAAVRKNAAVVDEFNAAQMKAAAAVNFNLDD